MTCENCVNHEWSKTESETNENRERKMYQIGFWENAEQSCQRFKKNGGEGQ